MSLSDTREILNRLRVLERQMLGLQEQLRLLCGRLPPEAPTLATPPVPERPTLSLKKHG